MNEYKPTDENNLEMAKAKDNFEEVGRSQQKVTNPTGDLLTSNLYSATPSSTRNCDKAFTDEDSWETKFNDSGDPTCPEAIRELELALGKVTVSQPKLINYLEFAPTSEHNTQVDAVKHGDEMGHVLELFGFPAEFRTRELMIFLKGVGGNPEIRWVDDEHALAVFSTATAARNALNQTKDGVIKRRPLSEASQSSQAKAKETGIELPHKARPETSSLIAKRLVSGALGIPVPVSREEREKEKLLHKEAKERRRQAKQQKKDNWDDD
ncbi:hypothetical protein BIW11_00172 [Tropilaelaps mercedesae]|uniref:Coiled-coil domain-containing protein R3HCC1L-like n=1 Tax=Tropilaelaps mercedesae TaxID=418985 RepID=A0A1V9Y0Q3_9ACAR|nr:hypothetical protein BIW11_00172 [Tropilaelaps mercedesae]